MFNAVRRVVFATALTLAVAAPLLAYSAAASGATPARPADGVITARAINALNRDHATRNLGVGVTTHDGVVALSGTVFDNAQRMEAIHVIQGVPGVVKVDNDMEVYTTDGMAPTELLAHAVHATKDAVVDGWVSTLVKAALLTAPGLKGAAINVSTHDGAVALTGELPSASMVHHAVVVARAVDGVRSVDASALNVG